VHERKPNRLKEYDYSQEGYYFVTICTKNKTEYFGKIQDGQMILNPCGDVAHQFWLEIPKLYENTVLDEFMIMPNHLHGIIGIVGNAYYAFPTDRTKMLLSKIIQQYKATVTKEVRKFQNSFQWQKSFYDHVIRNNESLEKIRKYIIHNPLKWGYDRENDNGVPLDEKKKFWKNFLNRL